MRSGIRGTIVDIGDYMSINIGDNNNFNKTTIIDGNTESKKESWLKRHPFLCSLIVSLISGFIMLFSFWQEIASFVENLFR